MKGGIMKVITKERVIFIALLLIAAGYGIFVTFTIMKDNVLMLVPKEAVEEVENCIDNQVGCGLVFSDIKDIPN